MGGMLGHESRQIGCCQAGDSINIKILGISDLDCIGMGDFNSDDHYVYYCGQELLEEME